MLIGVKQISFGRILSGKHKMVLFRRINLRTLIQIETFNGVKPGKVGTVWTVFNTCVHVCGERERRCWLFSFTLCSVFTSTIFVVLPKTTFTNCF